MPEIDGFISVKGTPEEAMYQVILQTLALCKEFIATHPDATINMRQYVSDVGFLSTALRNVHNKAVEECAKEIEGWIKYYSIEFFEDVKPGEHGRRVDDCTAHTMRVMIPRIVDSIRRLRKDSV